MTSRGSQVRSLSRPPSTLCSCVVSTVLAIPPRYQRHAGRIARMTRSLPRQTRRIGLFRPAVSASKNSVPNSRAETSSTTGWGAASSVQIISTIQSPPNRRFPAELKQAVSAGIFAGIVQLFRSLVTLPVSQAEFSLPSPHPKIPFPAVGLRPRETRECWEYFGPKRDLSSPVRAYRGFNPRASNCWLHSAGASRSRSTPMPRGSRPSTAARTRSGARNASEIVMLTWRTLHFWRVAIC